MQLESQTVVGGNFYSQDDISKIHTLLGKIRRTIEYANTNKEVVHLLLGTQVANYLSQSEKDLIEAINILDLTGK